MRKVVLDTNVLISGVIATGHSSRIVDAVRKEELKLVTSAHMLEEFSDVISRRHIARKYPKAAEKAEDLLDFLRAFADIVLGQPGETQISEDRDDDYVLACASEGDAEYIISGDPHLLNLKIYNNIPILSPREFTEQVLE